MADPEQKKVPGHFHEQVSKIFLNHFFFELLQLIGSTVGIFSSAANHLIHFILKCWKGPIQKGAVSHQNLMMIGSTMLKGMEMENHWHY